MRSVEDAARFVKETAIPGEIILLKSAPNLHLERIFDGEVRCWEQVCRKLGHCVDCGLFAVPFPQHKKHRPAERPQAAGLKAPTATPNYP